MDQAGFDRLARLVATHRTRRAALAALAGVALGRLRPAAAAQRFARCNGPCAKDCNECARNAQLLYHADVLACGVQNEPGSPDLIECQGNARDDFVELLDFCFKNRGCDSDRTCSNDICCPVGTTGCNGNACKRCPFERQVVDPETCRCRCPARECPEGKRLDPKSCLCECPPCPSPLVVSQKTCDCHCPAATTPCGKTCCGTCQTCKGSKAASRCVAKRCPQGRSCNPATGDCSAACDPPCGGCMTCEQGRCVENRDPGYLGPGDYVYYCPSTNGAYLSCNVYNPSYGPSNPRCCAAGEVAPGTANSCGEWEVCCTDGIYNWCCWNQEVCGSIKDHRDDCYPGPSA